MLITMFSFSVQVFSFIPPTCLFYRSLPSPFLHCTDHLFFYAATHNTLKRYTSVQYDQCQCTKVSTLSSSSFIVQEVKSVSLKVTSSITKRPVYICLTTVQSRIPGISQHLIFIVMAV